MYALTKELPSGRIKEVLRGSARECYSWLLDRGLQNDDRYCIDEVPASSENSGAGIVINYIVHTY